MAYEISYGRNRALCCVCGTCRDYSAFRTPPRYAPEGYSAEHLERYRDSFAEHIKPWHRLLGDLRCSTCGQITQHALLRDNCPKDEWRNYAELVNYGAAE